MVKIAPYEDTHTIQERRSSPHGDEVPLARYSAADVVKLYQPSKAGEFDKSGDRTVAMCFTDR